MTEVPVTAEWALWGKEPRDAEYRLLKCSEGTLGPGMFTEVITRYSPGNLERLPQVSVSWVKGHDHVAMAIHDTRHGLHDAGHRKIVFTNCFCVPYRELAAGAVSYQALYSQFAGFEPPDDERSPAQIMLTSPAGTEGPASPTATRVAALLLTERRVCIIGADHVGMEERLRFLDSVMALLPYGMRIELSASTWVSSTAEHMFRLFFTGAPRTGHDHVVAWGSPEQTPIGHRYADQYLTWLANGGRESQAQLAERKDPVRFEEEQIRTMLDQMHVFYDTSAKPGPPEPRRSQQRRSTTRTFLPGRSPGDQRPAPAAGKAAGPERDMSVEEILHTMARRLDAGPPVYLEEDLRWLRSFLQRTAGTQDRAGYQQIIVETGLLRAGRPVPKDVQLQFCDVLLQLAFAPLSYRDFRVLEDCAGRPPRQPLPEVIDPAEVSDQRVLLLVLKARGNRGRNQLRGMQLSAATLIETAANRELIEEHRRYLCEMVIEDLRDRAGELDPVALRHALARHGYLAGALRAAHPDWPQHQHDHLVSLLRLAHGGKLDRATAQEILSSREHRPTDALVTAVLSLVDPPDAPAVACAYARGRIIHADLGRVTRERALSMLPATGKDAGASPAPLLPRTRVPSRTAPLHGRHLPRPRREWRLSSVIWLVTSVLIILGAAVFGLTQLVSGMLLASPAPARSASAAATRSAPPPGSPSGTAPDPCDLVFNDTLAEYLPGAAVISNPSENLRNCRWAGAQGRTELFVAYRLFASGTGPAGAEQGYESDVESGSLPSSGSDGTRTTIGKIQQLTVDGAPATAIYQTRTGGGSGTRQVVELLAWSGTAAIEVQISYADSQTQGTPPPPPRGTQLAAAWTAAGDVVNSLRVVTSQTAIATVTPSTPAG